MNPTNPEPTTVAFEVSIQYFGRENQIVRSCYPNSRATKGPFAAPNDDVRHSLLGMLLIVRSRYQNTSPKCISFVISWLKALTVSPFGLLNQLRSRRVLAFGVSKGFYGLEIMGPFSKDNFQIWKLDVIIGVVDELDAFVVMDLGAVSVLDTVAFAVWRSVHANVAEVRALF